jgi:hypothetical protein
MANDPYLNGSSADRNEMFAIGAAAGALVATAIQEMLERRRKTPEGVSDQIAGLAEQGGKYVRNLADSASDLVSGAAKQGRKSGKQARKAARKQTGMFNMLGRRRKTPEGVSERVAGLAEQGGEVVRNLADSAGDLLGAGQGRKSAKRGRKAPRKQAKQAGMLKNVASGALGAAAVGNLLGRARERSEDAWLDGDENKTAKQARGWFRGAADTAQEYAASARESIQDAGSAKKTSGWWSAAADTVQDYVGSARGAVSDVKVTDRASNAAGAARGVLGTVGESLRDYVGTARGAVADVELGSRARDVAATARERIEEAKLRERARDAAAAARERIEDARLGEKARDYASVAAETLKGAADTARGRIEDVQIGDTVKEYSVKARGAAKVGAEKLTEGASSIAESTAEGAKDLRKGVSKGVKRTRRRVNWGLRAFIIGFAVGLLAAPQSGQRTRDTLSGFVSDLLDIVMPGGLEGQASG